MKKNFLLIIGILSILSLAIALVSQHYYDMQPCPWCILERMILVVLAIFSFGAYFYKKLIVMPILITTIGLATSVYHVVIASKSNSCNISLAEKIVSYTGLNRSIPEVFGITGMCADNYNIFGINYPIYYLILMLLMESIFVIGFIKRN